MNPKGNTAIPIIGKCRRIRITDDIKRAEVEEEEGPKKKCG